MTDVPNFKKGVGRLAVDRYDFQDHITGAHFRHAAAAIDLSPSILIGSTTITDVQTAIAALAGSIIVPSVPDATTVAKGIIMLAGDLFGTGTTATSPKVSGLQGTPISTFSGLTTNQVLTWNGTSWINLAVPGAIQIAGDLAGVGSTLTVPKVSGLQGFQIASTTPTNGQALVWNGGTTKWTPTGIPTSPTGTGFATLTSGNYDAAATANIRYTSGKFQTDLSIQYNNVGITGDLAWSPTSTNKTLTLPNATDTLVGLATTDTLTNKTINATNNTLTDTSAALGDVLAIISGTKFTRLAKGSNGTFLGVSGGTLGYFVPSAGTVPTGTGFETVTGGVLNAAATANIRYTVGGKFQTDTNIQFQTAGQIGDLAWGALSTTRTLSLPDATDTLVGIATADTLTNKTISATANSIIDASTVLGDLLKSNGTKFVRFGVGAALQNLRVNAGATDLEWYTPTTGSSSGINNTVQTSNGTGGFQGATDVLAVNSGGIGSISLVSAASFLSIGSGTVSTAGTIRLPYSASDVILSARDLGGTNREIISRPSANQYQIGPNSATALSFQFFGANLDMKPGGASGQFRVYGPTGTGAAITVSGFGDIFLNPNSFEGLLLKLNANGTGANAHFFNAPTVAAAVQGTISIGNSTAIPGANPVGGGFLYVEAGALKYRGPSGAITVVGAA
jgi:hypothetical protein